MSEFFSAPPTSPNSAHEASRLENDERRRIAQAALEKQAAHLGPALDYLRQQLRDRNIEPDSKIVEIRESELPQHKKIGRWVLNHATAEQRPKVMETTHVVAEGWKLSESPSRPLSVIMLEDGTLKMAEGTDSKHLFDSGDVDIDAYPFHQNFTHERGYARTYAKMPRVAEAGLIGYHSPEAMVGINLEHLAQDIRSYAAEHGIDGS